MNKLLEKVILYLIGQFGGGVSVALRTLIVDVIGRLKVLADESANPYDDFAVKVLARLFRIDVSDGY